jgi:glycosyltransferase involved in cell wall biosynthesis
MSGAMRVLHVSAYFAPAFSYGGPPRSILGLCRTLAKAGADVEVFTTTANGDEPLLAAPDGIAYEGVRVRYFPIGSPRVGWRGEGLAHAVAREARRADLVHVHGLWNLTSWAGVRAARAAGIPYVISPRGMLQPAAMARHYAAKILAYHAVEARNLRGAAMLHATSDPEARALTPIGPRVALVANGVAPPALNAEQVARVRQLFDLPRDTDLLLFLGRLHPIKRLDLLADAFALLRRQSSRSVCLLIAGPDEGGHRQRVEPLFAGVKADVRWTGAVDGDDKWALLGASRALVQCSDSESFGLSVAEALAAGVPVVVTERGAWREVGAVGGGFVVAHDAQAIAGALDRMLADPRSARAMGERGRAWALRTFGWDAIGRAMMREYDTIVGRVRIAAS